jgi:hypothetical protein
MQLLTPYSNMIGMVGVSFILTAYYMLNTHKFSAHDLNYQLLNFIGSWLILFSLLFHWNLSSVIIEIAWISISLIGLVRSFRKRAFAEEQAPSKQIIHIAHYRKNPTSVNEFK